MSSFTDELIASELKQSFKKSKISSSLSASVTATDKKILHTDLELIELETFKLNVLDSLNCKYKVLGLKDGKFCPKCRNKYTKMRPLPEVTENDSNISKLPVPEIVLFPPEDIILGWQGNVPVGSGFVNNGTTCYINSTLQVWNSIYLFNNYTYLYVDRWKF